MIDKRTLKTLLENGVDSSVILKLLDDDQEAPSVAEPEAPAAEEPKTEAVKEEPKEPENKAPERANDPILAAIEKLTGAIYKSNIMTDSREHGSAETTESILAKLINPEE